MTDEERRADGLRRQHRLDEGLDEGLPWQLLQPSEQAQWLARVRAASSQAQRR